jgi:hypothetical protein
MPTSRNGTLHRVRPHHQKRGPPDRQRAGRIRAWKAALPSAPADDPRKPADHAAIRPLRTVPARANARPATGRVPPPVPNNRPGTWPALSLTCSSRCSAPRMFLEGHWEGLLVALPGRPFRQSASIRATGSCCAIADPKPPPERPYASNRHSCYTKGRYR